jgi:hypothetical protein
MSSDGALSRADKQTKDKQTSRKEERHRRSILLITNYSLLIKKERLSAQPLLITLYSLLINQASQIPFPFHFSDDASKKIKKITPL